jgi:hypothetical protein
MCSMLGVNNEWPAQLSSQLAGGCSFQNQQLLKGRKVETRKNGDTETVFVYLLRALESIPSLAGRYDNPICRTGPQDYIGWRNRFLGIDSWSL